MLIVVPVAKLPNAIEHLVAERRMIDAVRNQQRLGLGLNVAALAQPTRNAALGQRLIGLPLVVGDREQCRLVRGRVRRVILGALVER